MKTRHEIVVEAISSVDSLYQQVKDCKAVISDEAMHAGAHLSAHIACLIDEQDRTKAVEALASMMGLIYRSGYVNGFKDGQIFRGGQG